MTCKPIRIALYTTGMVMLGAGLAVMLWTKPAEGPMASYQHIARRIASSVPYGEGPAPEAYCSFGDAVAVGSAHCAHYADAMMHELARRNIPGDIVELYGPERLVSHTIVSVKDGVIDPTLGIAYPHPLGQLLDNPSLANEYIGEILPGREAYGGERFFASVSHLNWFRVENENGRSAQYHAAVSVLEGTLMEQALPYLKDNNYGMAIAASGERITLRLRWDTPLYARRVGIAPDWLETALPSGISVTLYRGEERVQHVVQRQPRMMAGGWSIGLAQDTAFDRMEITFTGLYEKDHTLRLREILVSGWYVSDCRR